MTADDQIAALYEESKTLSPETDRRRLLALYSEIASLIDINAKPKKWAAFRVLFGQLSYPEDLVGTLQAYRDALPYWDSVADHGTWAECKSYIGWSLCLLGQMQPPENEEAIECLESSLPEYPDGTPGLLASLYRYRVLGDSWENWKKQIDYLQLAQSQVSVAVDPLQWAKLENDLAVALTSEPQGRFDLAVEERIAHHEAARRALQPIVENPNADPKLVAAARNRLIVVYEKMSEAYLGRVKDDVQKNRETAADYARLGRETCDDTTPRETRVSATLAWIRALINEDVAPNRERALQALDLCQEVDALLDRKEQAASTNKKFKALAGLRLLKLGDASRLAELLHNVDDALAMLQSAGISHESRVLGQLAAEALFLTGDFVTAVRYLEIAVDAAELRLAQASTRNGRLESIFELHDSYSWLAYCHLRGNELAKGLESLERGKARLWTRERPNVTLDQIRNLVPPGGALLFPVFAPREGLVAIVTKGGERICPLPDLGSEQLKAMLLADVTSRESDSWMARYCYKNDNPNAWKNKILSIREPLSALVWNPVIAQLQDLGVREDAELVWFPQGGLGMLPLQAADPACGYAIRYTPSIGSIAGKSSPTVPPRTLLVVDPPTDYPRLKYAALEAAWIQKSMPADQIEILNGSDASREEVLAALPNATLAHFCTHGEFETADPFQSRLLLADNERLTLDVLLPIFDNSKLSEVILSACETAVVPSWRFADELLGFPAVLLSHGASTVVASQWPVDDWASAALMGEFYRQWRTPPGKTAAQALRTAQNWLRNVSADQLYKQLDPFTEAPNPLGSLAAGIQTSLYGNDREEKPFAHPYYWAPFTVSGI